MQVAKSFGSYSYSPSVPEGETGSRFQTRSINSRRLLAVGDRKRPTPVSKRDFEELLTLAAKEPSGRDLIDIATIVFFTGLRAGEVARLRWSEVNFDKLAMLIISSKTGCRRWVPFASRVLDVLEHRREREPQSDLVLGQYPRRILNQVARLLWTLSSRIRRSPISMRVLRESFVWHWMQAGGNFAPLAYVAGYATLRGNPKSILSSDGLYAEAAKFQAGLEEQA